MYVTKGQQLVDRGYHPYWFWKSYYYFICSIIIYIFQILRLYQSQTMDFIDFVEVELRHLKKESLATDKTFTNRIAGLLDQIVIIKEGKDVNEQRTIAHEKILNELLAILRIIFQANNLRLSLAGLTLLQKTMNIKLLHQKYYQQIVDNLLLLKNKDDPQIQLKMIQTNLNLITPHSIQLEQLEYLMKVYHIAFQIATCKDSMTQRISISALMQLTELVFNEERFIHYSKNQRNNAFRVVKDFLVYVLQAKQLSWIPKGVNGIVWDLLLEITRYQGHRIREQNGLREDFQKMQEIATKSAFSKYENEIPKQDFLRFFRCFCLILNYLGMGHAHLTKLIIMKDLDKRSFLFSVYLEGVVLMLPNSVFEQANHIQEYFILFELLTKISEDLHLLHPTLLHLTEKKFRSMLQNPISLIDKELNGFEDDQTIFRIIRSSLNKLRLSYQTHINNIQNSNNNEGQKSKKTLERISPHLIKLYQALFLIKIDEDESRKFIQELQLWFLISSKLKLPKSKARFLEEISLLTVRIETKQQVIRCAQALQIMFNLIYGYQEYLDASSLAIMLRSFQCVEERFYNYKNNKNSSYRVWELEIGYELEPKMNMINSLYEKNTMELSESALRNTIEALNEITLNLLEELSEMSNPDAYSMRMKTFPVRKMKAVVQNHYKKLRVVWNFIVAHFIYLCACKSKEIRLHSIEILAETMRNLLEFGSIEYDNLFQIYFQIVKTKHLDIKVLVVEKLIKFVTLKGFKIDENHLVEVVKILKEIQHPNPGKRNQEFDRLMELENELNELIIKECLVNVESDRCLKELIHNYKIISDNKNHEYSGMGLYWVIADHLRKLWQKDTTNNNNNNNELNKNKNYEQNQKNIKDENENQTQNQNHQQQKINGSTFNINNNKNKKSQLQLSLQHSKEFEILEHELLVKLSQLIIKNIFHEVRQSGIHSMTQIIASNLPLYSQQNLHIRFQTYFDLFKQIISKYKSIVNNTNENNNDKTNKTIQTLQTIQTKEQQNNNNNTNNPVENSENLLQKQWYETIRFFYSNLFKLLKKLHTQNKLTENQLYQIFIEMLEILMAFKDFKHQLVYLESIQFLLDVKKEISTNLKFKQVETDINQNMIAYYEQNDSKRKKDRIWKNKIMPVVQELLEIYKKQKEKEKEKEKKQQEEENKKNNNKNNTNNNNNNNIMIIKNTTTQQ